MEVRLGNIFGFTGGNYAGNVYDKDFLAPTLNTMQGGCKQPMIIANINPSGNGINGAVHTVDAEAPTITTNKGEGNKIIVAMRGRNPENSSDRTVESPTEQRLEPNSQGLCNTLTSVQKDNLVMENVYDFYNNNLKSDGVCGTLTSACSHNGSGTFGVIEPQNVYLSEKGKKYVCDPKRGMCTDINADICQTLTAKGQSNWTGSFVSPDIDSLEKSTNIGSSEPTLIHLKDGATITSNDSLAQYRIRKLTPLECWRLMDFKDKDFEKAAQVNSNTQLYKQAGNSIVKNVLVAIIGQMIPGCENTYKGIDNE